MYIDIFIIAGGKCGSSTLNDSFKRNRYRCIKAHNSTCFEQQFNYNGFYKTMHESSQNKLLYIIDSYRTPIERKISSFFHNGELRIPNFLTTKVSSLIDIFNKEYLYTIEEYHVINDIFKKYNIPRLTTFPHKKKLNVIKHNNIIFIKLLYKHIDKWEKQLQYLFGSNFKIYKSNISNDKSYNQLYSKFLKHYKVPKSYLQTKLANDSEFKLYNSPQDQKAYISMWMNKSI